MRSPYPKLIAVILFVFTVIFAASTIPAVAENISGTVKTTGDNPSPIPYVCVNVSDSPCGGTWIGGAQTNNDGDYTITITIENLPTDTVYISTHASCQTPQTPTPQYYIDEWWDESTGTLDCNQAKPVQIVVGQDASGINFSLEQGGTISGQVTAIGGQKIPDVDVTAFGDKCWGNWPGGGRTDGDGIYTIVVPAGDYYVVAQPSSNQINYLTEWWNGAEGEGIQDCNQAVLVRVAGGQDTGGIDFALQTGGSVSGTVTDSQGNVSNLHVHAHSQPCGGDWLGGSNTDDYDGNYTLFGMPAGEVYIATCASCSGLTYVDEWYDNTFDCNQAKPVQIVVGQDTPDIDFSLVQAATISGQITDTDRTALPDVNVHVGTSDWGMGACTDEWGNYSMTGIPPGTYRVSAGGSNWCGGEVYKQEYYDDTPDWNNATEIELFSGDDISGINFSLELETAISGNISGDPGIGVRNLNVVLHDRLGRLVDWQTTWDEGHYYFDGLNNDETYTVKVYDPFLNYEYAEQGSLKAQTGGQVSADFTLNSLLPSGSNPPVINDAMAFIYRSPDGVESLMLTADISDPSGCQPASLKSVTAVGRDGQLHYLYHQKYQALLVDQSRLYGEFWYTSRDNTFDVNDTHVGDFIVTALDVDGNRVSYTAKLGSYNKLNNPTLLSPASGSQVIPSSLTLTWNSVSGAAAYQVRIYYLGERIWKSGLITETSLLIPGSTLSKGYWYRWEVIALDTNNAQFDYYAASATSSFFVIDETVSSADPLTLSVNIVPWISDSPQIPHDAYADHQTTFKAVAKGGTPPYTYAWDFGDGTTSGEITTDNGYNLEAFHQYSPSSDVLSATITVTDDADDAHASVSTTYPVRFWANPSRGVKVNVAIDDALWWLHKSMIRFTSNEEDYGYLSPWGYKAGSTALALQAWVLNGHGPDGNAQNPYVEDAIRAKEYILTQLHPVCIGPETIAGITTRDPDSNGNGQGLYVKNGHRLYETGLVLMALATLKDLSLSGTVQDLIDYLAYAQVEADVGGGRGGWRYDANYRESDMSVTQFPLMGLEAAEHHLAVAGVTIPDYVKDELKNNFLYYVQNKETGGFGYASPDHWLNVAKTGAGLVGLALTEIPYSDYRAIAGVDFIYANWLTADPIGPAYNIGDFYAMYAVMKGMKSYQMKGADTTLIGGHNWYDEYATWEIDNQKLDGSWGSLVNSYGPVVDTACGVLILLPQVFEIGPTAVAQASPTSVYVGEEVTFDHSASFHKDSNKPIVTYAWDFGDRTKGNSTTRKLFKTFTHSYASMGIYQATLTVTDDSGLTDTDQVTITVSDPAGSLPVIVEIKPETLNLGRNGVFSAYITFAAGSRYVLSDIDPDSLTCEEAPVTKTNLAANKLIAKFNTQDIEGVSPGDEVTFKLTGSFNDETLFEGSDTIRVIEKK